MKIDELKALYLEQEMEKARRRELEWKALRGAVLWRLERWGLTVEEGWLIEEINDHVSFSHPDRPTPVNLEYHQSSIGYYAPAVDQFGAAGKVWVSIETPARLFEALECANWGRRLSPEPQRPKRFSIFDRIRRFLEQ